MEHIRAKPSPWEEAAYQRFFQRLNMVAPYAYQLDVARRLAAGENLIVSAPTGAGKTLAALTPFLFDGWHPKPGRLIYALPLRTLAQSIYREAQDLVARTAEHPEMAARLPKGERTDDPFVTMQTGEQPDDEFFARGRIVITTYDQVLSGLLSAPYGLGGRLHNINSAALAGTLVVFDEFHLMEGDKAFLTAAAGLHLFRDLAQSVWMTATATAPLRTLLGDAVGCVDASLSDAEIDELPTVKTAQRRVTSRDEPLTAAAVLRACRGRTIVICNTVPRAQRLFQGLIDSPEIRDAAVPCLLLHSRFFRSDRTEKEAWLKELLGRNRHERAILVATQVIEAGIDISCDDLHTELCPMNALVQRMGRCARYPGERGQVHVYALPEGEQHPWLPYGNLSAADPALEATQALLASLPLEGATVTPGIAAHWVEQVHHQADARTLDAVGWIAREKEIHGRIRDNSIRRKPVGVTDLIRESSVDDLRVIVAEELDLPERPGQREAVTVSRWLAARAFEPTAAGGDGPAVWGYRFGDELGWVPIHSAEELRGQYVVCLSPRVARYTREVGLEIGVVGTRVSPPRQEPPRPGYRPPHREVWADHARRVEHAARRRVKIDDPAGWLVARLAQRYGVREEQVREAAAVCGLLHDLGKLQRGWQSWAEAWQRAKDQTYEHEVGLAHTDYDPDKARDRYLAATLPVARPQHAAQGAYLAIPVLPGRLGPPMALPLVSACFAAIVAHHGGWLPKEDDLRLQPLWPHWTGDLRAAHVNGQATAVVKAQAQSSGRRTKFEKLLDVSVSADALPTYWPLVAYLTRTLRLADQRATAEAGAE